MEHVKKMVLVPSETVAKINEKPASTRTPGDVLSSLDQQMHHALQQRGDDSEKWKHYEQLLQKFMHFVNEERKPIQLPVTSSSSEPSPYPTPSLRDQLLNVVPHPSKSRASTLYERLESAPNIQWDESGTVTINDIKYPGANIVDFINDVVRNRKNPQATHWYEFASALSSLKIPHSRIRNSGYLNSIRRQKGKGFTSRPHHAQAKKSKPSLHRKKEEKKSNRKSTVRWKSWGTQ